jgi:hypothetical protein
VIQIQFRRVPRSEIPTKRDAQRSWLLKEWQQVGAWVESHQPPSSSAIEQDPRSSA